MKKHYTVLVLVLLASQALAASEMAAGPVEAELYNRVYAEAVAAQATPSVRAVEAQIVDGVEYARRVQVAVVPESQTVVTGGAAVYNIAVRNLNPRPLCPVSEGQEIDCVVEPTTYKISVSGLPFNLKYEREIEIYPGSIKAFDLVVDTSAIIAVAQSGVEEYSADDVSSISRYRFKVSASGDDGSFDSESATLNVRSRPDPRQVTVSVQPTRKYVRNGETAVYAVTVADPHVAVKCASTSNEKCIVEPIIYSIGVSGLPFALNHPGEVRVQPGHKTTFELEVDTSAMIMESTVSYEELEVNSASQKILARRPYSFTVTAKSEDGAGSGHAVLYVGVPTTPPTPPGEKVEVELDVGWNIVSLPGVGRPDYPVTTVKEIIAVDSEAEVSASSAGLSEEVVDEIVALPEIHPRKYFFVYLKDEKRYATFAEAVRLMGAVEFRKYLQYNAFWVYTPVDDEFVFTVWRYTSYNGMPVNAGWNFIPVTKDMEDKSLDEIGGNCVFHRLYMWDSGGQQWYSIGEGHVFGDDEVYGGIVAYADGDCRLGGGDADDIPVPPPLPD